MEKKLVIITLIISIIAIGLACFSVYKTSQPSENADDVQYVMYLGTNDKDTNNPVFSREESVSHAENILSKYFDGFTIQDARGAWKNDDGSLVHEDTIVIILSDTNTDQVHKAAEDLRKEFNQNSVMIQINTSVTEFYSGV